MATEPELIQANGLTLLAFPANRFRLYAEPLGGNNARPLHASEALERMRGAVAVLNGPMFNYCAGQPHSYATSVCDRLDYLHADRVEGLSAPGVNPGDGVVLFTQGNVAQVVEPGAVPVGPDVAVQLYPALIKSGRVVASAAVNTESTWRSGAGVMLDGRVFIAVGGSMPMVTFAQRLLATGAIGAGYTDGGGSSSLIYGGHRYGSSENRKVPSFLVCGPAPGISGAAILAGLSLIGVGVALMFSRSKK